MTCYDCNTCFKYTTMPHTTYHLMKIIFKLKHYEGNTDCCQKRYETIMWSFLPYTFLASASEKKINK